MNRLEHEEQNEHFDDAITRTFELEDFLNRYSLAFVVGLALIAIYSGHFSDFIDFMFTP